MTVRVFKKPNSDYWYMDLRQYGAGRPSTKRTNKKEAQAVAAYREKELLDRKQLGRKPRIRVAEAAAKFLKRSEHLAEYRNLSQRLDKFMGKVPGVWSVSEREHLDGITTATLQEMIEARVDEGLANSTVNKEASTVVRMMNVCRKLGYDVPEVDFERLPEFESERWLDDQEVTSLLLQLSPDRGATVLSEPQVLQKQDAYDFVVCLMDTGMRHTEASTLPWVRVDTQRWRTLTVLRSKGRGKGTRRTTLPLLPDLKAVLQRRWADPDIRVSPYVFPGWDTAKGRRLVGKPRAYSRSAIMKAVERAGLNDPVAVETRGGPVTIHTLRHTFATRVLEKGGSLKLVQELLGHTSPAMTNRYAGLAEEFAAKQTAELFGAWD